MKPRNIQFSIVLSIFTTSKATSTCRCLYGQLCWPKENEFATLATQLSQPLLYPLPPASACYPPSAPSGNCSTVIANYTNGNWRSDQPGSLQNTNFETFIFPNDTISACFLNASLGFPCGQGSVPPVGVDVRSAGDVQVAIKFAKQHNLKLAVKNTGHDYLGRSTARGGFLIWTHYMKDIIRVLFSNALQQQPKIYLIVISPPFFLFRNKDGSLLEVYPQVLQRVLLEDGGHSFFFP